MASEYMGLLEAWAQQHRECKLGRSAMLVSGPAEDGSICIFGDKAGDCVATFVDRSGGVTPIRTGPYQTCLRSGLGVARGDHDALARVRPAVWTGGIKYNFTLLRGHTVFGVVEVGTTNVLLGFVGDRCALALYEPGRMEWIHVGPPEALGTVDIDLWRNMHPRPDTPPPEAPPQNPRDVELDQLRRQVVVGEVEEHDGPSPGKAVVTCLDALVDRAREGQPRTRVRWVVDLFVQLGQHGFRQNLVGTSGKMAGQISRILGVCVPSKELAATFRELVRMKCCLVSCEDRTWTVHLHDVLNRRSSLHRRFLLETGGRSRLPPKELPRHVQGSASTRATASNDGPPHGAAESRRAPDLAPEVDELPVEVAPVDPETSVVAGLCLLSLFNLAIEQRADEQDKARLSHLALKEAVAQHAAEREQWTAAQATRDLEVAALRAELAEREREGVDLRAELAARTRELATELATIRGQLGALRTVTGETLTGVREEVGRFVALECAEAEPRILDLPGSRDRDPGAESACGPPAASG